MSNIALRRAELHSMDDVKNTVNDASVHLDCVSDIIQTYDFKRLWEEAGMKPLIGVSKYQLFICQVKLLYTRMFQLLMLTLFPRPMLRPLVQVSTVLDGSSDEKLAHYLIEPAGLTPERPWYLHDTVRQHVKLDQRDILTPEPTVPNPRRPARRVQPEAPQANRDNQ